MKRKSVLVTLVLVTLLLIWTIVSQSSSQSKIKYNHFSTKVDDILFFGENKQYVVGMYKGKGTSASPTQNFLVYQDRKMQEREGVNNHQLKGDYWYLVIRDLRTPKFNQRKINIYEVLEKYDSKLQPWGWWEVYYHDRDYVALQVSPKDETTKPNGRYLFLDLETEKLSEKPKDFDVEEYKKKFNFGIDYTNLTNEMEPNDIIMFYGKMTFLNDGKQFPKQRNINLYAENPKLVKLLEEGKLDKLYIRKGQDKEAIFQDMRHWFAPVGQDKLDVIATNPKTGEQTSIQSYSEYLEWLKKNW